MTADWTACVIAHWRDPERPRRAMDGVLVCVGCHAKTLRALLQLAPLHRLLGESLAVSTAAPRNGSRSAEQPIPLNIRAADHRRHMRQKMASWITDVCDTQHLTTPFIDAANGTQRAMDAVVAWLLPWHDWLLAQDYADDYATDLADLHSTAWSIAYPSGRVRRTFAPCPRPDCAGTLTVYLAPGDLLPPTLTCDTCADEVPPARWLTGRTGPTPWLTVLELAELWSVPVRTVQRWSGIAAWPTDGARPARYDATAAQRTHDLMRAALTQVGGVAQDAITLVPLSGDGVS